MAALTLQNLGKIFAGKIRALDDLCLEAADGDRVVLAGPSGSGKTTALRLIAGLENPSEGRIYIDGRIVNDLPPQRRDVAMVFQHQSLYPHLNVYGNLAFGLKMRGLNKAEIQRRVAEAAAVLGISDLLKRKTWELSGGQAQRVALGRAMVRRPKIFLLDEPLSHLDAPLREQMRREIVRLHEECLRATMIYVTHDQAEAMTVGRRIVVLKEGKVQQVGDPDTLYRRPANRFVASQMGSPAMNFFPGRIECSGEGLIFRFECNKEIIWPVSSRWKTALQHYSGKEIVLGVRPEHLQLEQSAVSEDSLKIPAVVEAVESLGAESHLHLCSGNMHFICRAKSNHGDKAGNSIIPAANPDCLYFFDSRSGEAID